MDDQRDRSFASAVDRLMQELAVELGSAATLRRASMGGSGWELTPSRPSAAPVWVGASSVDPPTAEVMVGSEQGNLFEFGGRRNESAAEVLRDVELAVRSVIEGHVAVTVKRFGGATRCRLTLPDGGVLQVYRNWLLPVFPWTQAVTVQYEPYG